MTYPFTASPSQLATVPILAGTAIYFAYRLPVGHLSLRRGPLPAPWIVGATSFLLCSAFHLFYDHGHGHELPAALTLAGMLALEATAIALLTMWSRCGGWHAEYPLAAANGAILTYGWVGLSRTIGEGTTALGMPTTIADNVGQGLLLASMVGVIAIGAHRLRRDVSLASR